jgi:hypothetical protein
VTKSNKKFLLELPNAATKIDGRIHSHYSPHFMAKNTIGMFFFQSPSINAHVESAQCAGRIDEPTQRAIAYYLERSSVRALNELLWKQVYIAIRGKQLESLRGYDGRFTLAIDGVSLAYSKKRHCDRCLVTRYDDGTVQYHHAMLVASIVDKTEKTSIVVAVIPIENTPGYTGKQACELNAAKYLLDHLHRLNAHMKFNISVDGLYLSSEFIVRAKALGHEITMPLAKENMLIFDVLERDFKNRPIARQEDKSTTTTIEYGLEDVSMFWQALFQRNPAIPIYGLKRIITDKATGESRTCVIISTIQPTNDKEAIRISEMQRERWQQENNTFNVFKNLHNLKHIFNHRASAQVFLFAAIAINMRNIFLLRHPPQLHIKKPLSITALVQLILRLCNAPMDICQLPDTPLATGG